MQFKRIQLPQQIAASLRQQITRDLKPGDRMDSESKLALRFGVSIGTLREALRSLAQEGLLVRRHGSGTYVADASAAKHIAIITELDLGAPRISPFFRYVTHRLQALFREQGYRTKLYMGHAHPGENSAGESTQITPDPEFLSDIETGEVCGVAALATATHNRWLPLLEDRGIPAVGEASFPHGVHLHPLPFVREGTRYLLEHDRRRLAWLGWFGGPIDKKAGDPQVQAFGETMNAYGASVHPNWVRGDLHPASIGAGYREFRDIWLSETGEKPDGLLITDDVLIPDLVAAVLELSIRVPEELMIVTYANKNLDILCPFPTVQMQVDPEAFAVKNAEMLLKLIRGEAVTPAHAALDFTWVTSSGSHASAPALQPESAVPA